MQGLFDHKTNSPIHCTFSKQYSSLSSLRPAVSSHEQTWPPTCLAFVVPRPALTVGGLTLPRLMTIALAPIPSAL